MHGYLNLCPDKGIRFLGMYVVFSLKHVYAGILTLQILVSGFLQRNNSSQTWLQSQDLVCPLSSLFYQTVNQKKINCLLNHI